MKILKQIKHVLVKMYRKLVNSNPELNTEIAIEQSKQNLKKLYDGLVQQELSIAEREKTLEANREKLETHKGLLDASVKAGNKADAETSLIAIKLLEVDIKADEAELQSDLTLQRKFKANYSSAKRKIEQTENKINRLRSKKSVNEINKMLLDSAKGITVGGVDFSLDEFESHVTSEESYINADSKLSSELNGVSVESNDYIVDVSDELNALFEDNEQEA